MRFSGRVRFGDVRDADVDVVVEVGETHVRLVSGEESLGSWCLADVVANRVVANEFEIDLDGETITFLADDQVNFAYGAVQRMAEGWARYHAMNLVRRKRAVASARRQNEPDRLETVRRAFVTAGPDLAEAAHRAPAHLDPTDPHEETPHPDVEAPEPAAEEPAQPEEGQDQPLLVEFDAEEPLEPVPGEEPAVARAGEGFWDRVERATARESIGGPEQRRPDGVAGRLPRLDTFPGRRSQPETTAGRSRVEEEPAGIDVSSSRREEGGVDEAAVTPEEAQGAGDGTAVETPGVPVAPAVSEEETAEPVGPDRPPGETAQEAGDHPDNGHRNRGAGAFGSYRDGHHPSETSGLRASLRSLFSRGADSHEHSFVQSTTVVGLNRRVCIECGHVSIGVSE